MVDDGLMSVMLGNACINMSVNRVRWLKMVSIAA